MRFRLIAVFLGVVVLVLLAQDVPLAAHLRRVETERLLASLERDAFIIGGTAEDVLSGEAPAQLADLTTTVELYASLDGARVVVTDRDGIAIVVSNDQSRVGDDYSSRPEIAGALQGTPTSGRRNSATLGGDLAFAAVPVLSGAQVVGTVRITFDAGVIDDRAGSKVRGLVGVAVISLAAAAIAAVFMAGTVTRPLRRLQRSTEQVAAGRFDVTVTDDEGPPEVRRLARSFNTMTARVAELVEQQRAFAGDASHQLRTPLTALRLQLERASGLLVSDPGAAAERLEAAGTEIERLQHMVEGLLLLARADASATRVGEVDVAAITAERVEVWQALATDRGIRIVADTPTVAPAMALDGALEQVVDNLLDNALTASPPDGEVEVSVVELPDGVRLDVRDRGRGLTDEQLSRAFDRFWRAPGAPGGGSGLGLAVVRHLVTASGGEVSLSRREGGGTVASVVLRRPASA